MDDDDPTAAPGAAPAWLAAWWVDFTTALAFLTRLPLPEPDRPPDLARATRAMPLAGAVIGLGGAAVYGLTGALGLTPAIAGLLAVATTILLTGALHEDGLADSADGLFAGAEPARRLEIMRDSRTGAYGALALILSVGLRATALAAIAAPGPAAADFLNQHSRLRGRFASFRHVTALTEKGGESLHGFPHPTDRILGARADGECPIGPQPNREVDSESQVFCPRERRGGDLRGRRSHQRSRSASRGWRENQM